MEDYRILWQYKHQGEDANKLFHVLILFIDLLNESPKDVIKYQVIEQ